VVHSSESVVVEDDLPAVVFLEVVVACAQRAEVVLGGVAAVLPLGDVVQFAGGGGSAAGGVAAFAVAGRGRNAAMPGGGR
jgi:hypothetical protein